MLKLAISGAAKETSQKCILKFMYALRSNKSLTHVFSIDLWSKSIVVSLILIAPVSTGATKRVVAPFSEDSYCRNLES